MDRRKGRPHPQPNAYKVDHPYQLLALYNIWDAVKNLEDPEDRAWFSLDNPNFIFWCSCAGADAKEVRDRAYALIQEGAYTMEDADPGTATEMLTPDQQTDCSLTEEAICYLGIEIQSRYKKPLPSNLRRPQYKPFVKPPILLDISRQKTSGIPAKLAHLIMLRDCGNCRYCGTPAVGIDHVIPGGKACETNLVASCARCNNIKNDRPGFWLRYDKRLTKRCKRFYNTHPYGQKGTLWYRNKVISPRGLFGDEVWNYIKADTNKKGRRKFSTRRKRVRKE